MDSVTRRRFMETVGAAGAMGIAGASVAFIRPEQAAAEEAPTDLEAIDSAVNDAKAAVQELAKTGTAQADLLAMVDRDWVDPNTSDNILNQVFQESDVEGDLTLPDGTTVPTIYVRLRNRINRIGKGVGSNVDEHCWELLMYLWSEEDAAHELEMPMLKWFRPYDYAVESGRTEEECTEILEDLASRCLIYRVNRGGNDYYTLLPQINGFWEFAELHAYFENGGDPSDPHANEEALSAVHEFNANGILTENNHEFDCTFPLFRSYPISLDVIAEDDFAPYMDWRKIIEHNPTVTVSPCQCRLMHAADGVEDPGNHPFETCLSFGEMAEYFMENGIGRQITQEEAVAVVEDAIDKGMVPESIATKDADIICLCHGDCCNNLGAFKQTGGGTSAWKNWNAYVLEYDRDSCIQCGACAERCPMQSITFDADGYCVHDALCVRCGQCVSVCPAAARILVARDDYPDLPTDYLDCHVYYAKDRINRGFIQDFTGTSLG